MTGKSRSAIVFRTQSATSKGKSEHGVSVVAYDAWRPVCHPLRQATCFTTVSTCSHSSRDQIVWTRCTTQNLSAGCICCCRRCLAPSMANAFLANNACCAGHGWQRPKPLAPPLSSPKIWSRPSIAARNAGVFPSLSRAVILAPALTNNFTMTMSPRAAAKCKAVLPPEIALPPGTDMSSVVASKSAPASTSTEASCGKPRSEQKCSAVKRPAVVPGSSTSTFMPSRTTRTPSSSSQREQQ
mmetsp:Transcript_129204/g.257977  ORF Transcript_129204/g.257977 Transcript_129204/m.257977 type:complete len:241 (+) Transcript_129204:369-1091(+)